VKVTKVTKIVLSPYLLYGLTQPFVLTTLFSVVWFCGFCFLGTETALTFLCIWISLFRQKYKNITRNCKITRSLVFADKPRNDWTSVFQLRTCCSWRVVKL